MKTSLSKGEISSRAVAQLGAAHYSILTQSETSIVLKGTKAINWAIFVLLLCVVVVGAIIYYVVTKENQIVINMTSVDGRVEVTATGNTTKAQQDAGAFIASLPQVA